MYESRRSKRVYKDGNELRSKCLKVALTADKAAGVISCRRAGQRRRRRETAAERRMTGHRTSQVHG